MVTTLEDLKQESLWRQAYFTALEDHKHFINDEFKCEMEFLLHIYIDDLVEISMDRFEHLLGKKQLVVNKKFSWKPHHQISRGGYTKKDKTMINMAMVNATMPFSFKEYARFNDDPVIGFIATDDSAMRLKAIVTHEMAHAVQYTILHRLREKCAKMKASLAESQRFLKYKSMKPHGDEFQRIYRVLRIAYVNGK